MSLGKHRDFVRLWVAQTVSEIGSRITREGLPMGAVLMMGVSPLAMSGLSLAIQIPAAVLGLFLGVAVDRLRRRPLMIWTDVTRGVLLLVIPLAALTGTLRLWMFFLVGGLIGVLSLLFDVAYQAYLPSLVGKMSLSEANSKLGVTASAAEIIGPGLTGVLVQALTAPIAILFDALSYLFSALAIWRIRRPEPATREPVQASATRDNGLEGRKGSTLRGELDHFSRELMEGWQVLSGNRVLFSLAGATASFGFASAAMFVLDTLYALKTLGLSTWLFGLTVTMGGVGSLIGAGLASRVVQRWGLGKTLVVSFLIQGLSGLGWVFAGGAAWKSAMWLFAAQLFGDSSGMVYGILEATLRQTRVSGEVLGRVNATFRVAEVGMTAMGTLAAGLLAESVGMHSTLVAGTVGMVFSTVWLVFSPIPKLVRMPDGTE